MRRGGLEGRVVCGRTGTEVLSWIDDHSRFALSVTAHRRVTGPAVLAQFRAAVTAYGAPAWTLTGNGMVFTTRFPGGKGGRNALENELRRLGVQQKNGKPDHPQTRGKVERFQQTLKKWLRAQDPQPATVAQLQALLDSFTSTCSAQRPHRSLPQQATPAATYAARPKAAPGDRSADAHDRVRHDKISRAGNITLRTGGRLHHIGIGRTCTGTCVLLLIQDLAARPAGRQTGPTAPCAAPFSRTCWPKAEVPAVPAACPRLHGAV